MEPKQYIYYVDMIHVIGLNKRNNYYDEHTFQNIFNTTIGEMNLHKLRLMLTNNIHFTVIVTSIFTYKYLIDISI